MGHPCCRVADRAAEQVTLIQLEQMQQLCTTSFLRCMFTTCLMRKLHPNSTSNCPNFWKRKQAMPPILERERRFCEVDKETLQDCQLKLFKTEFDNSSKKCKKHWNLVYWMRSSFAILSSSSQLFWWQDNPSGEDFFNTIFCLCSQGKKLFDCLLALAFKLQLLPKTQKAKRVYKVMLGTCHILHEPVACWFHLICRIILCFG